jgi:uncharacterized protein with HEPN domain
MRLWLDHEYHRVDAAVVWRTVSDQGADSPLGTRGEHITQ